jgi:FKBP-type peptidyl-prolyl cis-trans isomerase
MKRYFLLLSLLAIGFSSCKKSSTNSIQAETDQQSIQAYIAANNITGLTADPSGLYYKIITPGNGAYPVAATSTVAVGYIGSLLDGTVFDRQASTSLALSSVIKGWQIGIPHVNTGGTIYMIIPSGLGYGTKAAGVIPANSVLVFTITLQSFHN